jgi:hypothetical protein
LITWLLLAQAAQVEAVLTTEQAAAVAQVALGHQQR